jgi:hypothetical protein
MKPIRSSFATVVALLALVVSLAGTTYAATGGTLILGHANSAGQVTRLTNPNGTALSLFSKSGTPALRVGNRQQVPNLNASFVGGKSAAQLETWIHTARTQGPVTPYYAIQQGSLNLWGGGNVTMEVPFTKHLGASCLVVSYTASNWVGGAAGAVSYGVYLYDNASAPVDNFIDSYFYNATTFHLGWSGTGKFVGVVPGNYVVRLRVGPSSPGMSVATDINDHASLTVIESPTGC